MMTKKDVVYGEIRGTGRFSSESVTYEAEAVMMAAVTPDPEDTTGKTIQYSITGQASEQDLFAMTTAIFSALNETVGPETAKKVIVSAMASMDDFATRGGRV